MLMLTSSGGPLPEGIRLQLHVFDGCCQQHPTRVWVPSAMLWTGILRRVPDGSYLNLATSGSQAQASHNTPESSCVPDFLRHQNP